MASEFWFILRAQGLNGLPFPLRMVSFRDHESLFDVGVWSLWRRSARSILCDRCRGELGVFEGHRCFPFLHLISQRNRPESLVNWNLWLHEALLCFVLHAAGGVQCLDNSWSSSFYPDVCMFSRSHDHRRMYIQYYTCVDRSREYYISMY